MTLRQNRCDSVTRKLGTQRNAIAPQAFFHFRKSKKHCTLFARNASRLWTSAMSRKSIDAFSIFSARLRRRSQSQTQSHAANHRCRLTSPQRNNFQQHATSCVALQCVAERYVAYRILLVCCWSGN